MNWSYEMDELGYPNITIGQSTQRLYVQEEDARLIVAAPDLLAAAKDVLELSKQSQAHWAVQVVHVLGAAIAKAQKGEQ